VPVSTILGVLLKITMKYQLSLLCCFLFPLALSAQTFIGAGNNNGVSVNSSSQFNSSRWNAAALDDNTINGKGLDAKAMEASRFLAQATLGYDHIEIDNVVAVGIESWIDDQLNQAQTFVAPDTWTIYNFINASRIANGETIDQFDFRPNWVDFNYAWWQVNLTNNDLLRHRVATALSEIFVVSKNSDLGENGDGLGSYYDMLGTHAFGNFRDLLLDVTLHPCMGHYLSHLNNPKADPANNTHPDENYAREVMQLFSIGLYELNQNGTRKLDASGNFIPTYGQEDIKNFAKIFTGLGVAGTIPGPSNQNIYFGRDIYGADLQLPMIMYNGEHEPGAKYLLNGLVVPNGQTGMQDIEAGIDNLFNHNNVGPFITYRLIQRLVKSNPSPAYVGRMSAVFANNGSGVRGDMAAVVKAILMDEEARDCSYQQLQSSSRLREPIVRYMHFARAVDKSNPNNFFWNAGASFYDGTSQDVLRSPSVFNFYLPDHAPVGDIDQAGLVAPEFYIHNSRTSVGFFNEVDSWTAPWGSVLNTWEGEHMADTETEFDRAYYMSMADEPEILLNELDRVFTHGTLSDKNRSAILTAIRGINESNSGSDYLSYRVYLATYLVMVSPDYAIMR